MCAPPESALRETLSQVIPDGADTDATLTLWRQGGTVAGGRKSEAPPGAQEWPSRQYLPEACVALRLGLYVWNCLGNAMARSFELEGSACFRFAPKRSRLPRKKRCSFTWAHSAAFSTAVSSSGCAVIVNCSA